MTMPAQPWVADTTLTCPGMVRTIRLEPLEKRHAPDLLAAADKELFRHSMQAPGEWSARGFEAELERVKALPGVIAFAIVLAESGRAIGRTTFMDIRPEHRGLEIGRTWIGRAHHGTRVNPEAKYLMLRHAFEVLSPAAVRVQITTNITNLHSQAAISKLGAVREGVMRKSRVLGPALDRAETLVRDWVYYSIVDDEWPRVKAGLEERLRAGQV
jgi:N-acetyltransferase